MLIGISALIGIHPNIYFAKKKEVHFFDRHFKEGLTFYLSGFKKSKKNFSEIENSFADVSTLWYNAEATPFYIASSSACRRMSQTIPNVHLIIALREPVARAFSEYNMKKR